MSGDETHYVATDHTLSWQMGFRIDPGQRD